jgi:hypothetical protein
MRIAAIVIGIILVLLGALWTLQGSNLLAGSAMSGQSQWLYIGIVFLIAGIATLGWSLRRR